MVNYNVEVFFSSSTRSFSQLLKLQMETRKNRVSFLQTFHTHKQKCLLKEIVGPTSCCHETSHWPTLALPEGIRA